ncbi:MAG: transposase, partial [Candidatus Faecousia sp.]|nr:transposase [Candidatus Faecousia sp.]
SSIGRNSAIPPRILFKILTYAYMEGIYSSRQIEKACKRDVNFMWLLEGFKAPEHSTISRFRKDRLGNCMSKLFQQLVFKLYELGEIKFENLFIDGTKIEANANKYSWVWKKAV